MGIISEMLSYPFMVRALIGGLLVSLCASLLGVSLVLKRYSMIGDGLSHVSFDCTGGRLVTFKGFDSGGRAGGIFPAADHGTWKSKE